MTGALWVQTGPQMVAFLLHSMNRMHFMDEQEKSPFTYSASCAFEYLLKYLLAAAKNLIFQENSREVQGLLCCDLDVKNDIWRNLCFSLKENRFLLTYPR